jgi:hypothetical protein
LDTVRFTAMRICDEALIAIATFVVACRIIGAGDNLDSGSTGSTGPPANLTQGPPSTTLQRSSAR